MNKTNNAEMRNRIIESAVIIASHAGFTRATTKEIAREAGCSEGIIYHYFKSKHDLFFAVIKENAEEFLANLQSQVNAGVTARDKLEKIIDFHFRYFTGKIHIFQILFGKAGDAMVPFPYVLKTILLPYQQVVKTVMEAGIAAGEFQPADAEVMATSMLGMMQFNIIKLHFGVSSGAVEEIKRAVKQIIFKALLKQDQA
ncbi:MAG: TetR/AcrR family transcriptional regulator [Candidatus Omnitrophica bacterium]|nr:TetR/AcrR family transcriptional regulator [Candidatus Omnitrophota bacterium]